MRSGGVSRPRRTASVGTRPFSWSQPKSPRAIEGKASGGHVARLQNLGEEQVSVVEVLFLAIVLAGWCVTSGHGARIRRGATGRSRSYSAPRLRLRHDHEDVVDGVRPIGNLLKHVAPG